MRQYEDQWNDEADIPDAVIYGFFFAIGALITLVVISL